MGNELSSHIGKHRKEKELSLTGWQLKALPPQISECKNLVTLDASNNELTDLPPEICIYHSPPISQNSNDIPMSSAHDQFEGH